MSRARRRIHILLLIVVFAAGIAYGMLAENRGLFPTSLTRSALQSFRDAIGGQRSPVDARGRWRESRSDDAGELTEEQRAEMERLESIGYLTGSAPVQEGESYGVTVHEESLAEQGLNLIVSGHGCRAALAEMDGSVVHEWQLDFESTYPPREIDEDANSDEYWRRVMLLDDGGILFVNEGLGVARLDRDSNLLWSIPGGFHHDMDVTYDGEFCVLYREARVLPRVSRKHAVLEDFIAFVDDEGNLLRKISILEAFERSSYSAVLDHMERHGDFMHTNTIEVLDGSLADRSPAFRKGNLLISVLRLNTIAVVDPETESVVWSLSGRWSQQHQPTVLPNGRMLLFNNNLEPGVSEVIEFDPFTQVVEWRVRGTDAFPFYSETCGSNQRLPNGNTLITESDNGRAFELTPEGAVVWEYVNPHRAGPEGQFVATLFEVVRMPEADRPGWLE